MKMRVALVMLLPVLLLVPFNQTYAQSDKTVILGTTTSVQETGLLEVLVKKFQEKSGLLVKSIAVGSGQAMQLGKQGEADILWVHSPDDEEQFVKEGFGTDRTTFMHNDFVILGPQADPAKVMKEKDAVMAFKKIADAKALFVSRGDKSGTHKKELKLWGLTGTKPKAEGYVEVGQGMAATIGVANEKQAYCLADRSSYLALKPTLKLVIVSEGDEKLLNRYSLILVNKAKFPKVNTAGAKAFMAYLLSADAKKIIEEFGKGRYQTQLFYYDYKIGQ